MSYSEKVRLQTVAQPIRKTSHSFCTPDIRKLLLSFQFTCCFIIFNLLRKTIVSNSRLRFGNTLFPSHSIKLSLNYSPLCTHNKFPSICDIPHILFDFQFLSTQHACFYNLFNSSKINFGLKSISTLQSPTVIVSTISLFYQITIIPLNSADLEYKFPVILIRERFVCRQLLLIVAHLLFRVSHTCCTYIRSR